MRLAISLRQLRAFAAVARLGSVRRAAEELNLSQPALSQSLRLLEEELGCKVLLRDARGAVLTEAGKLLLSTSESILDSLEFTIGSLKAQSRQSMQRLRIAALPSIARQVVVPAYRAFHNAGGRAELLIRDAFSDEVERMVRAREVDFGLAPLRQSAADLLVEPLMHSPMRVVTAKGHALATGATWEQLAQEHFIFVARSSATYEAVTSAFHAAGCFPTRYTETQTAETAACMAAEGFGVTVLHSYNIDEMTQYRISHGPVTEPERALSIALIRLADHPFSTGPAAFWKHLTESIGLGVHPDKTTRELVI